MSDKGKILVQRSDCCNAEVRPYHQDKGWRGITNYNECQKCKEPCDFVEVEWVADQGVVDDEAAKDNI